MQQCTGGALIFPSLLILRFGRKSLQSSKKLMMDTVNTNKRRLNLRSTASFFEEIMKK